MVDKDKLNIFRQLLKEMSPSEIKVVAQDAKDADIAAQYEALLNSQVYKDAYPLQQTEYRIALGLRYSLGLV